MTAAILALTMLPLPCGDVHHAIVLGPAVAALAAQSHEHDVTGVAVSPDGKLVASCSKDDTIKIWDAATGKLLKTLTAHEQDVYDVAFSPDGSKLGVGAFNHPHPDRTVAIWDPKTGQPLHMMQGHDSMVFRVVFSPDGKLLASCGWRPAVILWNAETGEKVRELGAGEGARCAAFSPDGKTLAVGQEESVLQLWNVETGEKIRQSEVHTEQRTEYLTRKYTVYGVAFTPDGSKLVTGGGDKKVIVWNAETGDKIREMKDNNSVNGLLMLPDGKTVIAVQHNLSFWNIETGQKVKECQEHGSRANDVDCSADGKLIASGADDRMAFVWDGTGKLLRKLEP